MMTRRYGQSTGRLRVWGRQGVLVLERDFIHCSHCEGVIELEPGTHKPVHACWCDQCGLMVCEREACAARCTPFVKQIEERIRRQEQFARLTGLEK